jgi:hypothetical protein
MKVSDERWDQVMAEIITLPPTKRELLFDALELDGMPRERIAEIITAWLAERKLQ